MNTKNKILFIRDSREHLGHGYDWGEDDFCRGTKVQALSAGDYTIEGFEHLTYIDRKQSTAEFAKNITEDRFLRLLEKIKKYRYKFFIMEFSLQDVYDYPLNSGIPRSQLKRTRIKAAYLESWISKISVDYGATIIFAGDAKNGEKICYSILKNIYRKEAKAREEKNV